MKLLYIRLIVEVFREKDMDKQYSIPSSWVSLAMPPMASFALRGTARELTLYCLVALTPNDAGIAYTN